MKFEQKPTSTTKQRISIARAIACLAVALVAAAQIGCSSTGGGPTQQVFRPQTQAPGFYANPAWGNQQGPFNPAAGSGTSFQGGSGTSFNPGGGSGSTFQSNPSGQFGFNGGGSGTSFQASSGSSTRSQFLPSGFNSQGFNPFGLGKTSC